MGDLNAKVEEERHESIIGKYGLGQRNERGERLIQFCQRNHLFVANTWFRQPSRKRYTWKSPGDVCRNQIDFVMLNERFRNSVKQAKTYPGADINSDHNPVVVEICIKVKKPTKSLKNVQLRFRLLKEQEYKEKYNIEVKNKYEALSILEEDGLEEDVEKSWNTVRECIQTSMKTVLPPAEHKKKKPWMTNDILKMMKERKKCKHTDANRYKTLNRQIEANCRSTKEKWLKDHCLEVENLGRQYKLKEMHKKVQEVTNRNVKKKTSGSIKDKHGRVIWDHDEVAKRWAEYITELYDDDREVMPHFEAANGKSILKEEVIKSIKSMKDVKAPGPDDIPAEAIKALDEANMDIITKLCNIIYNSGRLPTEMMHSIFITIPKKPKAQNCTDFRTISLMSHITKLLLKIIQQRIIGKIEGEISSYQSGFRQGTGTREGIFNIRTLCERSLEVQNDVYVCFIDYTKAFDRVKHGKMIECLSEIGVDKKDLQIITKLHWEQTAAVRTGHGTSTEFKIKRGVRQGCVLSPSLFNLYTEKIFRDVENMKGVSVGGVNINNLRYADDTALVTGNAEDLQDLLTTLNEKGKAYGMEINTTKTKIQVVNKSDPVPVARINLEGKPIEQLRNIIYLSYMATEDGKCDSEIRRRIGQAKSTFENMANLLTAGNISISLRQRILKCYIWSTLLYGAETWTLTKATEKKLEAFEMWMYRRMLKISWTQHKTNEAVLDMMNTKKSIINTIKGRKLSYFGHLIRRDNVQRLILEGKMIGKRARGRPRVKWTDNIKEWTGLGYSECVRAAQDREQWRLMTADLLRADGTR